MSRSGYLAIFAVVVAVLVVALFASGILSPPSGPQPTSTTATNQIQTTVTLTSPAFRNGERIPSKYTCDGANISPQLSWSGAPGGTKVFALIMDDLDAPTGIFTHWVIFNIPGTDSGVQENVPAGGTLPNGAVQGKGSFGRIGYAGPCPPSGTHRYVFHLYALDTPLNLPSGATKQEVLKAIEGHILAEAVLTGLYSKG